MLEELHPQLVAIALGSGLKKRLACDCMRAGANVIVEKPITLSLADADEMIATAKECGVQLCVNHQLRFGKTVRAVQKAAVEGVIILLQMFLPLTGRRSRFQNPIWILKFGRKL